MPAPTLKQFGDLKPEDFQRHPIWVNCHVIDYDEEWYDETTEETFRPWLDEKPIEADTMYLVAARLTFADGSAYSGFVTPMEKDGPAVTADLGTLQPVVFSASGKWHSFWFGMFPNPERISEFYAAFGKDAAKAFPILFEPLPGLTTACASGRIPGFCTSDGKVTVNP